MVGRKGLFWWRRGMHLDLGGGDVSLVGVVRDLLLEEGNRLRIGFGALKNAAALAAVLALLERLLEEAGSTSKPGA